MIKKVTILTSFIAFASVFNAVAQDDLYFTPKKKTAEEKAREAAQKAEIRRHTIGSTYYVGSDRDVDEYNRRSKRTNYFEKVGTDSLGNDIIEFHVGDGTYPEPDTLATDTIIDIVSNDFKKKEYTDEDSYTYTRHFSRFDGFYSPYYSGWYHYPGFYHSYFGFYDPWYWDPWYYDPFYDPWFYGPGWYSPWGYHAGYWGWHHGYWGGYWGGHIIHIGGGSHYTRHAGTQNHGTTRPRGTSFESANFSGNRPTTSGVQGITQGLSSQDRSNVTVQRSRQSTSGNFNGYRGNREDRNNTTTFRNENFSQQRQSSFSNSSSSSSFSRGGSFSGGGSSHVSGGGGGPRFGGRR